MKFEKYPISDALKDNLARLGFVKTTDIQFKAMPSIMAGEDVLAIAQTGTGKTAAFAIPIINQIDQWKRSQRSNGIQCIESDEKVAQLFFLGISFCLDSCLREGRYVPTFMPIS